MNRRGCDFRKLIEHAEDCYRCKRMNDRPKVLSSANGNIDANVVFIAEAPGRLGADKTLIPLHGDKAGDNFEVLLSSIGWKREDIFITNAVLCNPRNEKGNNDTPTTKEIANCSVLLRMTLELIRPSVIVTLGVIALKALHIIRPHSYTLRYSAGSVVDWCGCKLFIAYHVGQRARLHRSFDKQREDFYTLSNLIKPAKLSDSKVPEEVAELLGGEGDDS